MTDKSSQVVLKKQTVFWLGFFVLVGVILATLGPVLLPFILGVIVAYLFAPIVASLEEKSIPRALSSTIVIVLLYFIVLGTWGVVIPLVSGQFFGLLSNVPEYWEQFKDWIIPTTFIQQTQELIPEISMFNTSNDVKSFLGEHAGAMWDSVSGVIGNIWAGGRVLFKTLSLLIITPVVAFYMMRDWPNFVERVDDMLPRNHRGSIKSLLKQFDETLSGFIRGQAMVCLTLGIFYAVALSIVGLNFGIVIGLVAGMLSFIPYVGSIVGLVVSVGVAIFQFQNINMPLVVLGIFILGQLLEGNYLTPKLVGKRVGLHAVWVLLALMIGGSLFGFVGVLVAVPVAALLGVLIRFFTGLYKQSSYYIGNNKSKPKAKPKKTTAKAKKK